MGKKHIKNNVIVEKKLGIAPDYQYKALNSKNVLLANWHYSKFAAIKHLLTLNKKMSVMDLGTGSGNFELFFANQVKNILGVDYNDDALKFLEEKLKEKKTKNVQLKQHDILKLELLKVSEKFDLVVMIDVIEHIKTSQAKKLVRDLKRFLKPGGKVCIITPNFESPWPLIEKTMDKFTLFPDFDEEQHLADYDTKTLTEVFIGNNYKVLYERSFNLLFPLALTRNITKIITKFELSMPKWWGNLLFNVYELKD